MRKLASIRRIIEIKPIEGADAIEAVRVDGWWVVSKKNEFQVGDLCVYFEIDSFLPVRPEFEFLRKSCFRSTKHLGDGFRLKTVKLRGQISQGLALPLNAVSDPLMKYSNLEHATPAEGQDVTEWLGVKKWEMPIPAQLAGQIKGSFPSFIRKTDQERIQNCYDEFSKKYKTMWFEASLKLDGSSMTVYWNNGNFGVCSRNLELKETEGNTFWKVATKYDFKSVLEKYGKNIALQGELMGPGIQGNRENFSDHDFFLYDIWDIDNQKYFSQYERLCIYLELLNLAPETFMKHVPVITLTQGPQIFDFSLDEILCLANTKSINHQIAEGLVFKAVDGSVSFKAINQKFLLNEKD